VGRRLTDAYPWLHARTVALFHELGGTFRNDLDQLRGKGHRKHVSAPRSVAYWFLTIRGLNSLLHRDVPLRAQRLRLRCHRLDAAFLHHWTEPFVSPSW
jgi:hypothetical protein